jgi:hypothetical protein
MNMQTLRRLESGMRNGIVFVGLDDRGGPLFDCNISVPDAPAGDGPPTSAMRAAVADFYLADLDHISYEQAHSLLCYRDYARACADHLCRARHQKASLFISRLFVMFVSNDENMARDVQRWSERRFKEMIERSTVAGTKHFRSVEAFYSDLDLELSVAGCDLDAHFS